MRGSSSTDGPPRAQGVAEADLVHRYLRHPRHADDLGIKRLNAAARGAVHGNGANDGDAARDTTHAPVRWLDLFCTTSDLLASPTASSDGLHFDDAVNWRKAQALLTNVCD